MLIGCNVAQLLKTPTGTIRRVEIDALDEDLAAELGLVSPTRGKLRLMRTADGILVTGTLAHRVEATCSRCLEPFTWEESFQINEEFVPILDINTGLPTAAPTNPDAFRLTSDHLLDLSEAIRQYTILESPISPLCSPDCRGLCSRCGANLNLGPCGCGPEPEAEQPVGSLGELLKERLREAGLEPEIVESSESRGSRVEKRR